LVFDNIRDIETLSLSLFSVPAEIILKEDLLVGRRYFKFDFGRTKKGMGPFVVPQKCR
jgi:hypothetical protein